MKSEKGITMVVLIVTIVVIILITGAVIYNISNYTNSNIEANIKADMEMLHDKIVMYYSKYEEIPKTDRSINLYNYSSNDNIEESEDEEVYFHEIDLNKLENVTLNYGLEFRWNRRVTCI